MSPAVVAAVEICRPATAIPPPTATAAAPPTAAAALANNKLLRLYLGCASVLPESIDVRTALSPQASAESGATQPAVDDGNSWSGHRPRKFLGPAQLRGEPGHPIRSAQPVTDRFGASRSAVPRHQVFPCPGDPGSDGADGALTDLGGLGVGKAQHLGQDDGFATIGGEVVQQNPDLGQFLETWRMRVPMVLGPFGGLVPVRDVGDPGSRGAPSMVIDNHPSGDHQQPGADARPAFEAGQRTDGPHIC